MKLKAIKPTRWRLTAPGHIFESFLTEVSTFFLSRTQVNHICERMASHARYLLEQAVIAAEIEEAVLESACPGAGLYLTAHCENSLADFNSQGKRGKPAERVAEEACSALLHHYQLGSALEQHLADQLILPAVLCRGESVFSVERISPHLVTNAWVVERFGQARIDITPAADGTGFVKILANR